MEINDFVVNFCQNVSARAFSEKTKQIKKVDIILFNFRVNKVNSLEKN